MSVSSLGALGLAWLGKLYTNCTANAGTNAGTKLGTDLGAWCPWNWYFVFT